MLTRTAPAALVLVAAAVVAASSQGSPPQQPPAPPTFRSPVVAVPVDVRVIDNKTGKPVTDLAQKDFTVFEDGVRQDVRLFVVQRFDGTEQRPSPDSRPAAAAAEAAAAPAGRAPDTPAIAPQTTRVFLFVLGSGRLQEPSKGLDATLEFVRTRLRPKDLVAAFAYNRATAFTIDHERVARVIERFRKENDALDRDIRFAMEGLAGVYGSRELPKAIKARVDAIFTDAGSLPTGSARSSDQLPNANRIKADLRNEQEAIIQSMIEAGRAGAGERGRRGAVARTRLGRLRHVRRPERPDACATPATCMRLSRSCSGSRARSTSCSSPSSASSFRAGTTSAIWHAWRPMRAWPSTSFRRAASSVR